MVLQTLETFIQILQILILFFLTKVFPFQLQYHNMDVVHTSEASFTLNFGNDLVQNGLMNGEYEGPRRQTFFQLVNRRLFVTFVIGNLQSMQLYVYVQVSK